MPGREFIGYVSAMLTLGCGCALLWTRTAGFAARLLAGFLLFWFFVFDLRFILLAPAVEGSYQRCGETAVVVSGAWIIYTWRAPRWDRQHLRLATGMTGLRLARILYALALIAFGLSHFAYLQLTAPLVPAWLPGHVDWAYLTGTAYIAAALAILTGVYERLGATLSAVQMGLFTILVWAPPLLAGQQSSLTGPVWSEFITSSVLTTAGWVVADSYRGISWIAPRRRPDPEALRA